MAAMVRSEDAALPPTLEFAGVRMRPLLPTDADALFDYLSDPAVTELTAYPEISLPFVEFMIRRANDRWAAGEPAKWGIVLPSDDRVVGTCGFNEYNSAHRWAELAYDLAQPYWGKGLMRQAVAAALRWIYDRDLVERVHAYVRIDNARSARLLESIGFTREGRLRSFRVCRGRPYDYDVFSLLRAEWAVQGNAPAGESY